MQGAKATLLAALDRRSMDRLIRIDGRLYFAGRLAWLYMKGTWPKQRINCINGDRSDIRWANLREMTSLSNRHQDPFKAGSA